MFWRVLYKSKGLHFQKSPFAISLIFGVTDFPLFKGEGNRSPTRRNRKGDSLRGQPLRKLENTPKRDSPCGASLYIIAQPKLLLI